MSPSPLRAFFTGESSEPAIQFIPGEGIDLHIFETEVKKYLGKKVVWRRGVHIGTGREGYYVETDYPVTKEVIWKLKDRTREHRKARSQHARSVYFERLSRSWDPEQQRMLREIQREAQNDTQSSLRRREQSPSLPSQFLNIPQSQSNSYAQSSRQVSWNDSTQAAERPIQSQHTERSQYLDRPSHRPRPVSAPPTLLSPDYSCFPQDYPQTSNTGAYSQREQVPGRDTSHHGQHLPQHDYTAQGQWHQQSYQQDPHRHSFLHIQTSFDFTREHTHNPVTLISPVSPVSPTSQVSHTVVSPISIREPPQLPRIDYAPHPSIYVGSVPLRQSRSVGDFPAVSDHNGNNSSYGGAYGNGSVHSHASSHHGTVSPITPTHDYSYTSNEAHTNHYLPGDVLSPITARQIQGVPMAYGSHGQQRQLWPQTTYTAQTWRYA